MGTSCTSPPARAPGFRSRGRSRPPAATSPCTSRLSWTRSTLAASQSRRARWIRGTTTNRVFAETVERGVVPIICLRKGRAIPLTAIPYGTDEWKRLYRGRSAVEREFGRLKHEYGLAPLRTRGIDRVRIHADLTMLARLGQALARARAIPLAA
ncbi:MAG: transposase [Actinobacteria bacterium]|nr:transposase [Actinomycetota bacterium]